MSRMIYSVNSSLPAGWDKFNYDMELVKLRRKDPDFKKIAGKMGNYYPSRIFRIENPFMWGFYQLKKEECVKRWSDTTEKYMWHVTDPSYVKSIARNNFDWRLSSRCKFGRGVCFSPDLNHAMRYSTCDGAMILARVLVGASHPGSYSTRVPIEPCDSTTGWRNNVYVKYNDNEFYPAYVAYL